MLGFMLKLLLILKYNKGPNLFAVKWSKTSYRASAWERSANSSLNTEIVNVNPNIMFVISLNINYHRMFSKLSRIYFTEISKVAVPNSGSYNILLLCL